jgi:hypothetical protein
LIFEFTFNDSGPMTYSSSASGREVDLEFQTQNGDPADWHGVAGSGVSGLALDRSFDNTASTGMGSGESGGRAIQAVPEDWGPYDSFTFSGWYRTQSGMIGSFGRLFWWDAPHQLYTFPDQGFFLAVNSEFVGSPTVYDEEDEWVFFAVSHDGTQTANNVVFYKGTVTGPVVAMGTVDLDAGPFSPGAQRFSIGNNPPFSQPTQPFDGWLDNFRLHAGEGSTGVLSAGELEAMRAADAGGTLPALRFPTWLQIQPNGEQIDLQWWSLGGYDYFIDGGSNPGDWTELPGGPIGGDGTLKSVTRPQADSEFYRLRILPQD